MISRFRAIPSFKWRKSCVFQKTYLHSNYFYINQEIFLHKRPRGQSVFSIENHYKCLYTWYTSMYAWVCMCRPKRVYFKIKRLFLVWSLITLGEWPGGSPRVVVSSGFGYRSRRLERSKTVSSSHTRKTQYCGEPQWPRGSVLGLRPAGLEFRILCLEGSVIIFISQFLGGSPGPV